MTIATLLRTGGIAALFITGTLFVGCDGEVEDGLEDAGDGIENAAENVEDTAEDAGDNLEQAVD
jgi:hypothetical protein